MKLNADKQFAATKDKVIAILSLYGLECLDFELAKSGIENGAIICTLKDKTKRVLRVYRKERKSDDAILTEANFVNYLHANGVPAAKIIPNNTGDLLSHYKNEDGTWQVVMMPFYEGEHTGGYSAAYTRDLAQTQARMHILSEAYEGSKAGVKQVTELRASRYLGGIEVETIEYAPQREILQRAAEYNQPLDEKLPRGLCHRDYDEANVLAQADRVVAVLDFDDLAIAPYVLCLSYTLWDVYYYNNEVGMQQYLSAYQLVRKLTDLELSYIWRIMLFRHYKIAAIWTHLGEMDTQTIDKYIEIENQLLLKQV